MTEIFLVSHCGGINVNVSEQEKDVKQLSEIVSPYVEFMTYLRQCLSLQRLIWR